MELMEQFWAKYLKTKMENYNSSDQLQLQNPKKQFLDFTRVIFQV